MKRWPRPLVISLALLLVADAVLLIFLTSRDDARAVASPAPQPVVAAAPDPEPVEPAPIDDPRWHELRTELRAMAEAQALEPEQLQDFDDALAMIGAHIGAGSRELTIDVGSRRGRLALRGGWSIDEHLDDGRTAVWSSGVESELDVVLAPGDRDWWFEMLAHGATRGDITQQAVEVLINGERAGELVFPAGFNIRGLRIPNHLLRRGRNRLTLRFATPIGIPGESRTLSLYVDQLWLAPDPTED